MHGCVCDVVVVVVVVVGGQGGGRWLLLKIFLKHNRIREIMSPAFLVEIREEMRIKWCISAFPQGPWGMLICPTSAGSPSEQS